jgi:hypothetical protein
MDLLACHSIMSKEGYISDIHRDAATLSQAFRKALAHFISPNNDTIIGMNHTAHFLQQKITARKAR